ncbi:MAG TPA: hypothetical protein VHF58_02640 [Solirubrobacterales bacterium]|nr:hypothetical protein [Solirubrobacterales bacterium]
METNPRPDQEGFGEASLGEAQSENPPPDPDMIDDDARYTGGEEAHDTDSEPATTPEDLEQDLQRDQAEG